MKFVANVVAAFMKTSLADWRKNEEDRFSPVNAGWYETVKNHHMQIR